MKRLIFALLLLPGLAAFSQTQPPNQVFNGVLYQNKNSLRIDSNLFVPKRDTAAFNASLTAGGNIRWRPSDGLFYGYDGVKWNAFASASGFVPTSRTLNIIGGTDISAVGGTQDLSANRSWTVNNTSTLATVAARGNTSFVSLRTDLATTAPGIGHYGYMNGGQGRFAIGLVNTESGSNSGSDYFIARYPDVSDFTNPLFPYALIIKRSTGVATFGVQPMVGTNYIWNSAENLDANSPILNQLLRYDGSVWSNWTPNFLTAETDDLQDVTSRGATTNVVSTFSTRLVVGSLPDDGASVIRSSGTVLAAGDFRTDLAAGQSNFTMRSAAGVIRWGIGSQTTEAGSNSGYDFALYRFSDAGAGLGTPFSILRSNGFIGINNSSPTSSLHIVGSSASTGSGLTVENSASTVVFDAANNGVITINGVNYVSGNGSPESVVTAPVGSVYTRKDGGAGTTLYIKESGAGNTGWIAK